MHASGSAAEWDLQWVGCHLNPVGDNLKAGALRSSSDGELPLPPSAWQQLTAKQAPGSLRAIGALLLQFPAREGG